MEDDEIKAVDDWMENMKLPAPSEVSEDSSFVQWHDARDVFPYAADCSEYSFCILEETTNG